MEKIFQKSDYIKVHQYALEYKEGNLESGEKLIEAFNLFIYRYANFLAYGVYDINNYSLRSFISLYIENKQYRKFLHSYKYKPYIQQQFGQYALKTSALFEKYSFEELYNECVCVLLNMAKRYKDTRPSFHTYVFRCYHFELERNLKHLIKDVLVKMNTVDDYNVICNHMTQYDKTDDIIEELNKQIAIKNSDNLTIDDEYSVYEQESLNLNWINGITCSDVFLILTTFERDLLVSNYILKKTDAQIAEELGLCRATVNRKKTEAKKKIQKILQEKNIII